MAVVTYEQSHVVYDEADVAYDGTILDSDGRFDTWSWSGDNGANTADGLAFAGANYGYSGTSTVVTVTVPDTTITNGIMFACCFANYSASGGWTIPAGWTTLFDDTGPAWITGQVRALIMWRKTSSEPASYSFQFAHTTELTAFLIEYHDVYPATLQSDFNNRAATNSHSPLTVQDPATTLSAGTYVRYDIWGVAGSNSGPTAFNPDAATKLRVQKLNGSQGFAYTDSIITVDGSASDKPLYTATFTDDGVNVLSGTVSYGDTTAQAHAPGAWQGGNGS